VLREEGDHFVDIEIRQHDVAIGQGGCAGLPGDFLHVAVMLRVGDDVDFFKRKTFAFEVSDGVNTPRASGFDVNY